MIDDATLAALRARVHARPDVQQALAAERDATIFGYRLQPGQRAGVLRQAYREEWTAMGLLREVE